MRPIQDAENDDVAHRAVANPGYALGQLAKAFQTSRTHVDADTRERASAKIERWVKVYEGMIAGALDVGSRTPLADVPAWATLEVVHGGFATGDLLAGGAIEPHERELLATLPPCQEDSERAAINGHYLSDVGIADLQRMLADGRYRVDVPEEGTLLVVAWLLGQGDAEAAREILDAIGPFLSRLRFYPRPDPTPLMETSVVHLRDLRETIRDLAEIEVPHAIQVQREAILVWTPLFDRMVGLFLETVDGPHPSVRRDDDGVPLRTPAGSCVVEGGWPCQLYPEGWKARAEAVLRDYRQLRSKHRLSRNPENRRRNFARLRGFLETCVRDPRKLTGRDVGLIRAILANVLAKHGAPGSEDWTLVRERQAAQASAATHVDLIALLRERLGPRANHESLDTLEGITTPVTQEEVARSPVLKVGQPMPKGLARKLRRSLAAPLPDLVELGVIPSGEVLAQVIPQITARVRATGLADADLRRLYGALYTAFRRRRSLLLLNLESQVRFEELPWVRAIDARRRPNLDGRDRARQTLEQVVTLAIASFPQQILPNKLLQEIRALAKDADLKVPIVDEVAADIFMGTFSEKFVQAAQIAGARLKGTLYERYYGVPYDRVLAIKDLKASAYGPATSKTFDALCAELAGGSGQLHTVARNGTILEQEQILTTHNLATLFEALDLDAPLGPRLRELAGRCFEWTCLRLGRMPAPYQSRLRAVKNAAYAWRQMVFFLTLLPEEVVDEFLAWAYDHLAKQTQELQDRFRPALDVLAQAAEGHTPGAARRFLGWTTGTHWLLA